MALWKEFEEAKTPEAQRARELDAFECILQADEYEERSRGKKNLDNFLGLKSRISSPEVRQYLDLMLQAKEARRTREHLKPYSKILIIFVLGPVLRAPFSFAFVLTVL
jgi:5'-deoxynucleotidase YfbR-like HD superfamily hydrolase